MRNKEKESKRNERNGLYNAVDTVAHVEIDGKPFGFTTIPTIAWITQKGYPQYPQHDGYWFMQFL
jgi:hypothetical protein